MTLQEAFDINWKHFVIEKGKPAFSPILCTCLYHTDDGCKCAIGLLLPSDIHQCIDKHENDLNGVGLWRLRSELPEVDRLLHGIPIDDLIELQEVHDNAIRYTANFSVEIAKSLERFATKYNLVIPSEVHS